MISLVLVLGATADHFQLSWSLNGSVHGVSPAYPTDYFHTRLPIVNRQMEGR